AAKEAVSHAAALSLARHHGLAAELTRKGVVPGEAMAPYVDRIDEFSRVTTGADWHEILITSYVTSGLLNDFFLRLAGGFSGDVAERLRAIYSSDDGHELLVGQLREAIEQDPPVASRLAMWGRRLVGDTLLIARSVVFRIGESDEARLEPVFTELIAAHTRRMDALGLTA
ncbi:MAG TPA: ferritin-like fold-containing protein, partial [Lacisediminihabitans sp.]|uniref:ferritin-like fold-containing protein n=1 Tax=Lacisediminihabitans sp. TaxID=2787631 RepID=UPI002EDA5872